MKKEEHPLHYSSHRPSGCSSWRQAVFWAGIHLLVAQSVSSLEYSDWGTLEGWVELAGALPKSVVNNLLTAPEQLQTLTFRTNRCLTAGVT